MTDEQIAELRARYPEAGEIIDALVTEHRMRRMLQQALYGASHALASGRDKVRARRTAKLALEAVKLYADGRP